MLDGQLGLGRPRDNRKMFPSLHLSVTLKVPMETNLTITLPKSFNRLIEFMQISYTGVSSLSRNYEIYETKYSLGTPFFSLGG